MPHRLFIAIRPPEAVRDALVDTMERLEGARWVPDDKLHLTLRFIGEVERPLANDIAAALARIEWPGFALSIDGVGHFAQRGRPTAVWARIVPSPALEGLRQKVEAACERAGAGREVRRFVPHITIARRMPVSRPAVSQHLRVLKDAGLVRDRAVGTRRLYQVNPDGVAALRAYLDRFWDQTLGAFATAVEQAREEET